MPSGRFPSPRSNPMGSRTAGKPDVSNVRLTMSFSAVCRGKRPEFMRQESGWRPNSSTIFPQRHRCCLHYKLKSTFELKNWVIVRLTQFHTSVRWLGHVRRMYVNRIPQTILYGELTTGRCPFVRPTLRYKYVYKRDLELTEIPMNNWESLANDRNIWRQKVKDGIRGEETKKPIEMHSRMIQWQHSIKSNRHLFTF